MPGRAGAVHPRGLAGSSSGLTPCCLARRGRGAHVDSTYHTCQALYMPHSHPILQNWKLSSEKQFAQVQVAFNHSPVPPGARCWLLR